MIRGDFNLEKIAKEYQKNNNVNAISVLTDAKYFGGALTDLELVGSLTTKPILRKDFIFEKYQIYESRYYGADAVLLISKILTKTRIINLIRLAKKYNMNCLVEVCTEEELKKVLQTNAEIIGINNRDLTTLKIDLNTTLNLIKKIPRNKRKNNKIIITESGYNSKKEIGKVRNKVDAILIGTTILKAEDINQRIGELLG